MSAGISGGGAAAEQFRVGQAGHAAKAAGRPSPLRFDWPQLSRHTIIGVVASRDRLLLSSSATHPSSRPSADLPGLGVSATSSSLQSLQGPAGGNGFRDSLTAVPGRTRVCDLALDMAGAAIRGWAAVLVRAGAHADS